MDSPTSRAPPVEIDPWGEAPEPTYTMSASTTTAPKTTTPKKAAPAKPKSVSPAPKTASSPLSVPSPTISRVTSPTPSTGGMSKEDKATEMARRKEERKQVEHLSPSTPESISRLIQSYAAYRTAERTKEDGSDLEENDVQRRGKLIVCSRVVSQGADCYIPFYAQL
jgi:hypothetical protein